jgi:predicted anti-sigma-YlaC factor YlaD
MKNNLVILGGLLVVINSTMGVVLGGYKPFNLVLADFSILLSITMLYVAYKSSIADGFKIGFTVLFALTGLIRFICCVIATEQIKNNIALLVFLVFLSSEFMALFVARNLRNK